MLPCFFENALQNTSTITYTFSSQFKIQIFAGTLPHNCLDEDDAELGDPLIVSGLQIAGIVCVFSLFHIEGSI